MSPSEAKELWRLLSRAPLSLIEVWWAQSLIDRETAHEAPHPGAHSSRPVDRGSGTAAAANALHDDRDTTLLQDLLGTGK